MNNNNKTVCFRLSETTYNNMVTVCELLGMKHSDFMRMAINQYIGQASMQSSCINLAKLIKTIRIEGMDKEKAEQIEKYLMLIGNLGGLQDFLNE